MKATLTQSKVLDVTELSDGAIKHLIFLSTLSEERLGDLIGGGSFQKQNDTLRHVMLQTLKLLSVNDDGRPFGLSHPEMANAIRDVLKQTGVVL